MTKKKIVVTGSSGHLGTHIILNLINTDYSIQAQYYSQKPAIESSNLQWIKGDISKPSDVEKLIYECDVVIHCAALVTLTKTPREEILETNVLGTQNIVDQCIMSKKDIRFIYISSTTVSNPIPFNKKSDELRPYLNNSNYAYSWSKSMAEQNVLRAIGEKNLDAIILRPSALIGPSDYKPSLFGDFVNKFIQNKLPVVTTGGYNMVDIRDAAQTIVNAVSVGKKGEIYNIGGKYKSLYEITKMVSRFSGSKLPSIVLPISMTIIFEPLIRMIFKARNLDSPFSRENMYFVKNGVKMLDSSKAINELNHKCRPTEETIKDLVDWFVTNKVN